MKLYLDQQAPVSWTFYFRHEQPKKKNNQTTEKEREENTFIKS